MTSKKVLRSKYILVFHFSDISMSLDQACLFTSITQLGFPVGGLLSGYLTSKIGLKYTSLFGQAVSYILGNGLLVTAINIEMLEKRATEHDFPTCLARLAVAQYTGPRWLYTHEGAAQPVSPNRGIALGCGIAMALV